jgi:S-layer protein
MTNANATTATSTLALSAAFAGKVTGFERLEITAPGTNATPIDVAALLGATNGNFVTLTGGAFTTTLNNLGSGTAAGTLTVNATTAAGNTAVVLGGTTGAGSTDVLNLNLKDTTALGTVVAFGSVTAPNVETINLAVNDTRTTTVPTQALNTVTLVDTGLQNLNISGNQSVALAHTGTALTKLDASGLTLGNVTFTASALQYASVVTGSAKGGDILNFGSALAAVTITATAGTNTITGSSSIASTLTGGSGADFITGGSGADVINGGAGSDTIVAGAGANVITGGSGADLIVIAPTGVTPSATNFQTITDFNKAAGTSFDTIAASALILGTQTAAAAVGVATITAGVATFNAADTTFAQHLAAVAAALQTTAGATAIWQEGADSYLYIADNTLAVAATDTLVKLVGVTAGALTVAGNAITAVA